MESKRQRGKKRLAVGENETRVLNCAPSFRGYFPDLVVPCLVVLQTVRESERARERQRVCVCVCMKEREYL